MNSYYSRKELQKLNFMFLGDAVKISKRASIYSPEAISIGNHVRIDDFCILSGKITIGNYIHIAPYSALFGGNAGIELCDFVNLSSRVSVYALTDDYSGQTMTNPMIPNKYKNVTEQSVRIGCHAIIGASSVVLPGVEIGEGGSFGAFSLINSSTEPWTINVGIPCRVIKNRKRDLLKLEQEFKKEMCNK